MCVCMRRREAFAKSFGEKERVRKRRKNTLRHAHAHTSTHILMVLFCWRRPSFIPSPSVENRCLFAAIGKLSLSSSSSQTMSSVSSGPCWSVSVRMCVRLYVRVDQCVCDPSLLPLIDLFFALGITKRDETVKESVVFLCRLIVRKNVRE